MTFKSLWFHRIIDWHRLEGTARSHPAEHTHAELVGIAEAPCVLGKVIVLR